MARRGGSLRASLQRRLVLEIVENTKGHPTAQAVFEKARRRMATISLATIYRNLRLLVRQGTLIESKIGQKPARFEVRKQRHYHVCCLQCGALEDLRFPYQEALDRRVERLVRYRLREHRMEFYGVCPRCQAASRSRASRRKNPLYLNGNAGNRKS